MMVKPTTDLWALDEVHFQQHGSRCRMWVPPEITDPVLLHAPTRKSVGYFGAVRLRDGRFVYIREDDSFNGDTCWSFLKYLHKASAETGQQAVVIADNARYHHAAVHKEWRKEVEDSFALDYLPPYSPELNPAERIWKLTRRRCIHNRYFADLSDVVQAVELVFQEWARGNETLRRLCAII